MSVKPFLPYHSEQVIKSTLAKVKSIKNVNPKIDGNTITWLNPKNKQKSLVLTVPLTRTDFSSITVKELNHTRVYNQPSIHTINTLIDWLLDSNSILTLKSLL